MEAKIIISVCLMIFGWVLVTLIAYFYGKSRPLETLGIMKVTFDPKSDEAKVELEIDTDPALLKDRSFVIFEVDNPSRR